MKKYDVTIKIYTGSYYQNGEKCYNEVAKIRSDSLDYIWKIYISRTNEIDRYTQRVVIQDNNGNYDRDVSNM